MNPLRQRAELLFQQQRFDLAADQLRQLLAQEPDDAAAHALLGLCLAQSEKLADAEREATQAVHLAPDLGFAHYVVASVLSQRGEYVRALGAIDEAIRLEPEDPAYHAVRSQLFYQRRDWPAALAAAEQALTFDPEHVAANNLRAMALTQLGRRAEAGATLAATLSRAPEDPWSHANLGWTLLHSGKRKEAQQHFREALRLDPDNEHARLGILEAIKAGNPVYSLMLRWFLWMQRLSSTAQWGVILGGYFGSQMLSSLSRSHPEWSGWILPVQILYISFVLLTWLARPLGNLMLRLHSFGRLVLTPIEAQAANAVGGCLFVSLLFVSAWCFLGFPASLIIAAAGFLALSLPVAGIYQVPIGWPKYLMLAFAGLMAVVTVVYAGASVGQFFGRRSLGDVGQGALGLMGIGFVACPWIVNALMLVRLRR